MDITKFPKEVLFDLLLMVQPHEIDIVCRSKNSRVRAICSSKLFQQAYKLKYPRKLMTGKISYQMTPRLHIFTDENGNRIHILYRDEEIEWLVYIPSMQVYDSTYINGSSFFQDPINEKILSIENPLEIYIKKQQGGEYEMSIGRSRMYGVHVASDEKTFLESYNSEVREFLEHIGRSKWYSEKLKYKYTRTDNQLMKEFNDEIVDVLKDVQIEERKVWEVIKPLKF